MTPSEQKALEFYDTYFDNGGTLEDLSLDTIVLIRLLEEKKARLDTLN